MKNEIIQRKPHFETGEVSTFEVPVGWSAQNSDLMKRLGLRLVAEVEQDEEKTSYTIIDNIWENGIETAKETEVVDELVAEVTKGRGFNNLTKQKVKEDEKLESDTEQIS